MGKNLRVAVFVLILLVGVLLYIPRGESAAGNICDSASPCSCGSACQNGGYESNNSFNTIDGHLISGCQDGAEDSYEYTHDINVTNLDRDIFAEGDKIRIDGIARCDGSGDYVMFLYYNGTRWKHLGYSFCSSSGINTFTKNVTLDEGVGNHTVRVSTFWAENTNDACASSAQCGKDCESVYSDTDDVSFFVQSAESSNPEVEVLTPIQGREFNFVEGYVINISASVNDTNSLTVEANVTWASGGKIVNLTEVGEIYIGNFTDETYIGRYNVTIIAEDVFGNINNTEATYFHINKSLNITLNAPEENSYLTDGNNLNLNFEVRDDYDIDTVRYEYNGAGIKVADFGIGVVNNQSPNISINNSVYENLSQSFNFSQELEIRRVDFYLRKNGTINDVNFEIRTDSSGPTNTVLANGSVDSGLITDSFDFVTGFLNSTTTLQGNTTYWVVITNKGNTGNYLEWQTNDNLLERGNAFYNGTHNTSQDFLFKVQDEFLFNSTIDALLGKNNLTIYKNNTPGVEQSKSFSFTVDNSNPYFISFDYNDTLEIGNTQSFTLNTSDKYSTVETAFIEYDSQNYSMTSLGSNVFTYSYIPNITGEINFSFHINDSAGNMNNSQILSFNVTDASPPVFVNISHSPTSIDDIDPNVTLNVSVNLTDYSNLSNVILQYKLQSQSWQSKEMTGSYLGNFTPNTTGTWFYRIFANDTFSNSVYSENYSINISFDTSWTINPASFGVNSTTIGEKITIGTLFVNNTGDFNRTFNISDSGTPVVVYNRSFPFTLEPKQVEKVKINVTAPITEAEYDITFTITDTTNNTVKYSNFTLVAHESGPYLFLEFPVFDSSVQQGEHINLLSLKITNLGNETSTGTEAVWSLPSGITSRDSLNKTIGNLGVGAVTYFNISADVSSSATTGTKSISASANNSQGTYKSISRSITITGNSSPPDQDPGGGSSSPSTDSSAGPAGGVVVSGPELEIDLTELRVPRGIVYETKFRINNNESVKTYYNVSLEIDGIFNIFYNMTPRNINRIRPGDSREINLVFNLPDYYSIGPKNLKLIINPSNTEVIEKDFRIVVFDSRDSLSVCLNTSKDWISEMRNSGVYIENWEKKHNEAIENFNESNYNLVKDYCTNINSYYEKFKDQKQQLTSLTSRVIQLKEEGYDTERMEEFLRLANSTFYQGNFDKVSELITETNLLIETAANLQKPALIRANEFFQSNKAILLSLLIIVPVLVFVARKVIYITKTENRIRDLQQEKQSVLSLMKKAQKNYFKDSLINRSLYDSYVKNYRERIGDINVKLADLKLSQKHYLRPASEEHILKNQKKELESLIKENQDNYYNRRIIDNESYSKLEQIYTKILSSVEAKLPQEPEEDEEKIIEELEGETVKLEEGINLPVSDKVSFRIVKNIYEEEVEEIPHKVMVYFDEDSQVSSNQIDQGEEEKEPEVLKEVEERKEQKRDFTKLKNPEQYFYLVDGIILKSIPDLLSVASLMDESVFNHHVNEERNDFAKWVRDIFREEELANALSDVKSISQMKEALEKFMGEIDG